MKETWAKNMLRGKGWSYRRAAPVLGVTFEYLCRVCNGVHTSVRLNKRIFNLPDFNDFVRCNPNFFEKKRTRTPRRANRRGM